MDVTHVCLLASVLYIMANALPVMIPEHRYMPDVAMYNPLWYRYPFVSRYRRHRIYSRPMTRDAFRLRAMNRFLRQQRMHDWRQQQDVMFDRRQLNVLYPTTTQRYDTIQRFNNAIHNDLLSALHKESIQTNTLTEVNVDAKEHNGTIGSSASSFNSIPEPRRSETMITKRIAHHGSDHSKPNHTEHKNQNKNEMISRKKMIPPNYIQQNNAHLQFKGNQLQESPRNVHIDNTSAMYLNKKAQHSINMHTPRIYTSGDRRRVPLGNMRGPVLLRSKGITHFSFKPNLVKSNFAAQATTFNASDVNITESHKPRSVLPRHKDVHLVVNNKPNPNISREVVVNQAMDVANKINNIGKLLPKTIRNDTKNSAVHIENLSVDEVTMATENSVTILDSISGEQTYNVSNNGNTGKAFAKWANKMIAVNNRTQRTVYREENRNTFSYNRIMQKGHDMSRHDSTGNESMHETTNDINVQQPNNSATTLKTTTSAIVFDRTYNVTIKNITDNRASHAIPDKRRMQYNAEHVIPVQPSKNWTRGESFTVSNKSKHNKMHVSFENIKTSYSLSGQEIIVNDVNTQVIEQVEILHMHKANGTKQDTVGKITKGIDDSVLENRTAHQIVDTEKSHSTVKNVIENDNIDRMFDAHVNKSSYKQIVSHHKAKQFNTKYAVTNSAIQTRSGNGITHTVDLTSINKTKHGLGDHDVSHFEMANASSHNMFVNGTISKTTDNALNETALVLNDNGIPFDKFTNMAKHANVMKPTPEPVQINATNETVDYETTTDSVDIKATYQPDGYVTIPETIDISSTQQPVGYETTTDYVSIKTTNRPVAYAETLNPSDTTTARQSVSYETIPNSSDIATTNHSIGYDTTVNHVDIINTHQPIGYETTTGYVRIKTTKHQPVAYATLPNSVDITNTQQSVGYATRADPVIITSTQQSVGYDTTSNNLDISTRYQYDDYETIPDPVDITITQQSFGYSTTPNQVDITTAQQAIGYENTMDPIYITTTQQAVSYNNTTDPVDITTTRQAVGYQNATDPEEVTTTHQSFGHATTKGSFDITNTHQPFIHATTQDPFNIITTQHTFSHATPQNHNPGDIRITQQPFSHATTHNWDDITIKHQQFSHATTHNPDDMPTTYQPFSHATTQHMDDITTTQTPFSHATTQNPDDIKTTYQPFSHETTQNPDDITTTHQPFSHVTTQNADHITTTHQPFSHAITQNPGNITTTHQPFSHATTHNPDDITTAHKPFSHATTQNPDDITTTHQPFSHATTHNPDDITTTHQPFSHATTQNMGDITTTHQPFSDATTQIPKREFIALNAIYYKTTIYKTADRATTEKSASINYTIARDSDIYASESGRFNDKATDLSTTHEQINNAIGRALIDNTITEYPVTFSVEYDKAYNATTNRLVEHIPPHGSAVNNKTENISIQNITAIGNDSTYSSDSNATKHVSFDKERSEQPHANTIDKMSKTIPNSVFKHKMADDKTMRHKAVDMIAGETIDKEIIYTRVDTHAVQRSTHKTPYAITTTESNSVPTGSNLAIQYENLNSENMTVEDNMTSIFLLGHKRRQQAVVETNLTGLLKYNTRLTEGNTSALLQTDILSPMFNNTEMLQQDTRKANTKDNRATKIGKESISQNITSHNIIAGDTTVKTTTVTGQANMESSQDQAERERKLKLFVRNIINRKHLSGTMLRGSRHSVSALARLIRRVEAITRRSGTNTTTLELLTATENVTNGSSNISGKLLHKVRQGVDRRAERRTKLLESDVLMSNNRNKPQGSTVHRTRIAEQTELANAGVSGKRRIKTSLGPSRMDRINRFLGRARRKPRKMSNTKLPSMDISQRMEIQPSQARGKLQAAVGGRTSSLADRLGGMSIYGERIDSYTTHTRPAANMKLQDKAPKKRVSFWSAENLHGMSIYGSHNMQPTSTSTETPPSTTLRTRGGDPFGGERGYWAHLTVGLMDMLCELCRHSQLTGCIRRHCSNSKQGEVYVTERPIHGLKNDKIAR